MSLVEPVAEGVAGPRSSSSALLPLLRWAGGKRWLVPLVDELASAVEVERYHEPFAGGAALFFGTNIGKRSFLSDLNPNLIETYLAVRDDPEGVWERLRQYQNAADDYYAARESKPRKPSYRAARFIFLNHTSFNGLYRVNLKGEYNVPFGYRHSDNRPTREHLLAASQRLASASLVAEDFSQTRERVGRGDLVFLDPPYTVAHNRNGFVKYNGRLFLFADQERLSALIDEIRAAGAYYVMTNAAHVSIAELFEKGDSRIETSRKNAVGGRSASRGRATEYLFTNLPVS